MHVNELHHDSAIRVRPLLHAPKSKEAVEAAKKGIGQKVAKGIDAADDIAGTVTPVTSKGNKTSAAASMATSKTSKLDDALDAASAPKRITKAAEEIRNIKVTGWAKGKEAGHFADHAADMGITSQPGAVSCSDLVLWQNGNLVNLGPARYAWGFPEPY